jgi:hypothetical protein
MIGMQEYKSDGSEFYRRTRNRVTYEVIIFISLSFYFWSDWSSLVAEWLKTTILAVLAAYILIGMALYPKAKAAAKSFSITLLDDALKFPKGNGSGSIPYSDLVIIDTKLKNNEIVQISLRTKTGQKIYLNGLNNMKGLYKGLIDHGVKEARRSG